MLLPTQTRATSSLLTVASQVPFGLVSRAPNGTCATTRPSIRLNRDSKSLCLARTRRG